MTLDIPFDNSYGRLPDRFYVRQPPTPVSQPEFIAINEQLAQELGLDVAALKSPEGLDMFAGNAVPDGADPLAQAYSGHQFGGWSPELGDGRALLIGEILDTNGLRRDIQLKGSGPTPFSRRGDGRSALGPVVREYLVSEAMHALGIPTTRATAHKQNSNTPTHKPHKTVVRFADASNACTATRESHPRMNSSHIHTHTQLHNVQRATPQTNPRK